MTCTVSTRTGDFAVVEHGASDGRLVLALHGFPDTPGSLAPLARLLAAAGHRVVAPYLRGYAPSPLAGPHTIAQLADDAHALLDALSPEGPAAVIGHDWGALATYALCARSPERVTRAVTMAVPHPAAFLANLGHEIPQLGRSWYMLFFQLPLLSDWALRLHDFALVERLWRAWSPGFAPPPEHLAEIKRCLAASLPAPIDYYRQMLRGLVGGERPPVTPLHVPFLFLQGEDDGCIGAALGAGHERLFGAGYRRELVPRAGHFLHLERPEAVAALIASFLA